MQEPIRQTLLRALFFESGIILQDNFTDTVYGHFPSSKEQTAGSYPDIATLGQQSASGVSLETSESSTVLSYVECGTNLCGEEGL